MNLIKEEDNLLHVQCNMCKKEFSVEKGICTKNSEGYVLNEAIKCSVCGQKNSTIIDYNKMLKKYNSFEKNRNIESWEREKREKEREMNNPSTPINQFGVRCPKCGVTNIQVLGNDRKNFSVGKAIAGTFLAGGIGALAGFAGKKGKYDVLCNKCGHRWKIK